MFHRQFKDVLTGLLICGLMMFGVCSHAEVLVLGQLSDQPQKDFKELRPMVRFVADALQDQGISRGEVVLFSEPEELAQALRSGRVHWVSESPFTAAYLVQEAAAIPLLYKWKAGQKRYQSLVYTHKDSGIRDLSDLSGKRLAFEKDQSFGGYYLPRLYMEQRELKLEPGISLRDPRRAEVVNFVFSRNARNNLLWVQKGLADAGAINTGDWYNIPPELSSVKDDLRIICATRPYPRALELVSSQMPEARAEALKELLLSLNPEEHAELLERYENTDGFEDLPPDADDMLAEIYQRSRNWQQ